MFTFCCFINSASNAPVDKAREHGAGRHPLVQLPLLWVLGLRRGFMRVPYNRPVMGENREDNNVMFLISQLFITFDRQSDDDEYQIYAFK